MVKGGLRMTNKEMLMQVINNDDQLIEWLSRFADWYDPGGWHDETTLKKYLDDAYDERK